ncbi:MAG: hypothetical protein FJ149_09910 [Euryarchaeota archaeon]|nr:hypothetical protein [Euryarchaeota archaeon]
MSDRTLVAVSICSLLGTLGLYGYAVLSPPPELSGLGPDIVPGSQVRVRGLVGEVRALSNGGLAAEILPGGHGPGVRLYVPADVDSGGHVRRTLLTGASVEADGRVEEYLGSPELVLDRAHKLRLLSGASLSFVLGRPDILANSSVCVAGWAFYKELRGTRLDFRVMDRSDTSCELNCSSTSYDIDGERLHWGNGTLVRVLGRLRYYGEPPVPRLYVLGGPAGVEPL